MTELTPIELKQVTGGRSMAWGLASLQRDAVAYAARFLAQGFQHEWVREAQQRIV